MTSNSPKASTTRRRRRASPERELSSVIVPGARPRPPFLFEEFGYAVPARPVLPGVKRRAVTMNQICYMLYARGQGSRVSEISARLNIPRRTVEATLAKARDDTRWMIDCGWVVPILLGAKKADVWLYCRFCAEMDRSIGFMALHAWGHVWPAHPQMPAQTHKGYRGELNGDLAPAVYEVAGRSHARVATGPARAT